MVLFSGPSLCVSSPATLAASVSSACGCTSVHVCACMCAFVCADPSVKSGANRQGGGADGTFSRSLMAFALSRRKYAGTSIRMSCERALSQGWQDSLFLLRAHRHARTHTDTRTHAHTHRHTHTDTHTHRHTSVANPRQPPPPFVFSLLTSGVSLRSARMASKHWKFEESCSTRACLSSSTRPVTPSTNNFSTLSHHDKVLSERALMWRCVRV